MKTSTVHERCWSWIAGGPESYRKIVDCLAINQSKALYRQAYAARSQIDRQTRDLASAFNVHPKELEGFLQGLAAGDWIRRIRKYTSEAEPIALNQTVAAGENAATVYLSNGWHSGEQNLRWTCEEAAYIHFSIDASDQDLFLRLRVATLRPDIPVTFLVDGQPTVIQRFAAPSDVILPLGRRTGLVEVEIRLDTCVSPKDLGLSEDWRSLGVALYEFELETQRE